MAATRAPICTAIPAMLSLENSIPRQALATVLFKDIVKSTDRGATGGALLVLQEARHALRSTGSQADAHARMIGDLGVAVRGRKVSAREIVERSLARIARYDGELNAIVALRPEEALAEAAALDERVARGEDPGPLAGLPFLVKDLEDLAGMPTTCGSMLLREAPAAANDGLIAGRLRAAGAIPVGKTNTPEFACEGFTANRLFGVTRNPWSPEWSPGGSSGGSGTFSTPSTKRAPWPTWTAPT